MKNPLSNSDLTAIAEIAAKLKTHTDERDAQQKLLAAANACIQACDLQIEKIRSTGRSFDDDGAAKQVLILDEKRRMAIRTASRVNESRHDDNIKAAAVHSAIFEEMAKHVSAVLELLVAAVASPLVPILGEAESRNTAQQAGPIRHLAATLERQFMDPGDRAGRWPSCKQMLDFLNKAQAPAWVVGDFGTI